jgi:uncharacterized membrane protein SpoIIM required for sporulation
MAANYSSSLERGATGNLEMAGFYVLNNVGIALRALGSGLLGCVATAWVLVFNGLKIGAVAGFLASQGEGGNLLRYTSGHSAWELTATVISGGAGFKLGWALIAPGESTRLGSLRKVAPSVIRLAAGVTAMLLVAASIEGFWSARDLPDSVRTVFAVVNVVIVGGWLGGIGRRRS